MIFKGVKSIIDDGYGQLIKNNSSQYQPYCVAQNLDNYVYGVNQMLANKLKIARYTILNQENETYYKSSNIYT